MGIRHGSRQDELDALLEDILVDAYGDDEQLWAFRQAFEDNVDLPADAFVIGEPVSVIEIDYDGNERRGLTATCRREDASEHVVVASELRFPEGSEAALHVAAYRKWLGLEPMADRRPSAPRRHKATADDLDLSRPIKLIVLAIGDSTARCRIPGSEREITLRARGLWKVVPGEIVTVHSRKQWRYAGHPYLSGEVDSSRLDLPLLGLTPLDLYSRGTWDPAEQYWGEEDEPLPDWAKPLVERGPRPQFEMQQVLAEPDPDDPLTSPILAAIDLRDGGDPVGAEKILMDLLREDLRCLDAHAHLGNFVFDHRPEEALRHYEVGKQIGELSLGADFDGVLLWGWIDNRPLLRCLHGYGLCLWRLERSDEAAALFERMLWLNPGDNQGARVLVRQIRDGESWEQNYGEP